MAFIQCEYFSSILGMCMQMNMFLPQQAVGRIGEKTLRKKAEKYPALYLLHGLSDDHTIWQRLTGLERYASELPLAVVMPNAHRSFYTNTRNGLAYETALTGELIANAESFFPISNRREQRFVAGLSMGGYGAMKFALKRPDLYSRVVSFSGALDIRAIAKSWRKDGGVMSRREGQSIFGKRVGPQDDLFELARQIRARGKKLIPKIQIVCGTGDFLYQDNLRFKAHLESLGIPFEFREGPGEHNWAYWDMEIRKSLRFLSE